MLTVGKSEPPDVPMAMAMLGPSRSPVRRWACGAASMLAIVLSSPIARAADGAVDDEAAICVAVMQMAADSLARQVKAGDSRQEPQLRLELRRAAALIGRTYLNGLHDEAEAKARLDAARKVAATWPQARRDGVHEGCVKKADAELASASSLQLFIVERVAERRMQKMLESP